jgi:hypothetical protein
METRSGSVSFATIWIIRGESLPWGEMVTRLDAIACAVRHIRLRRGLVKG